MENDSSRKYIALAWALFGFFLQDFRGDETWSATPPKKLISSSEGRQSKINDNCLQGVRIPEHNVFWFEVTMDDPQAAQVVKTQQDRSHHAAGLSIAEIMGLG